MNNKAMSTIVASILIILLVLISIGVIWGVISNVIRENAEKIDLDKTTLDLKIKSIEISNDSVALVLVKRGSGEGEFIGFKLVFDDGQQTEVIEINESMEKLQQKLVVVFLEKINSSEIKSVGIYPIFRTQSGKLIVGTIRDEIEIKDKIIKSEPPPEPPPGCSDTCLSLGYECGTQTICENPVDCGTCNDGEVCTSDTCNAGTCEFNLICGSDGNCCESQGCADDPDCPEPWETGIVSWWSFDKYNSTHILDNSSYGHDAEFFGSGFGTSYLVPGKVGNALSFTLDNEYLNVGKEDELNWENTNGEFSVGLWIRQENTGAFGSSSVPIVQRIGGATTKGWKMYQGTESASLTFWVYGYSDSYVTDTGPLPVNIWTHIIATSNSTHTCIYRNGGNTYSDCDEKGSGSYSHPDNDFFIGTYYAGQSSNFYGSLDEIIMWNRALSSSEINDIYNYF